MGGNRACAHGDLMIEMVNIGTDPELMISYYRQMVSHTDGVKVQHTKTKEMSSNAEFTKESNHTNEYCKQFGFRA